MEQDYIFPPIGKNDMAAYEHHINQITLLQTQLEAEERKLMLIIQRSKGAQ